MLIPERAYTTLGTRSTAVICAAFCYLGHIVFQGKIAGSEIGSGFAMLFVCTAIAVREIRFSAHILYFPLFLYGLASTISALMAPRAIHTSGEFMLWVKIATFPTALILFRIAPPLRRLALYTHAFMLTFIATRGLIEFVRLGLSRIDLEHRIKGGESHVMTFSGLLLPLSLLFAVLWLHERRRWMLLPAALGAFVLLLTFTRSAWLAWVAAVFVLLLATRPRRLAWAIPVVIVFVTFLPAAWFGRLASSFDMRQESNLDRIRMFQAGVEIVRDYPLFGVGPANVKQVYPLYRPPDAPRFRTPHLHNNVMQIWAERGIVALAAYLLLLALFLRECVRGWRGTGHAWAQAGVAIAISLTFAGLFEFNFGDTEVFYLTMDLFALVVAELEAAAGTSPQESSVLGSQSLVLAEP